MIVTYHNRLYCHFKAFILISPNIQLKTKSNPLVTNYKPNIFCQRHDQIGVLTDLSMLHTGSTGQSVHCGQDSDHGSADHDHHRLYNHHLHPPGQQTQ